MNNKSVLSEESPAVIAPGNPAPSLSSQSKGQHDEAGSAPPNGTLKFSLSATPDRLALLLSCEAPAERLDELLCLIESALVEMGIKSADAIEEVKQRVLQAVSGKTQLLDEVILEGKAPVLPTDGTIEWAGDYFTEGFVVDEQNRVDYRRLAADRSVSPGQLLARLSPPKDGEEGVDVFGKAIKVRAARPARLQAGKNVEFREEEASYYAAIAGRIRYTGKAVVVDDVYTVNGNVGLKTGHIKHFGALVVMQDIEADACVEVEGDIEVHGNIEDAEIRTNGKLIVHGGICGREHCTIHVGNSLTARFIQNADIEAGGNVAVDREIDKSNIKSRGFVIAGSRIVGGTIMALGGIESDQIGSDGCVRTTLIAGEDYLLDRRVAGMEEELAGLTETLEKITKKIKPFQHQVRSLSPKVQQAVATLVKEARRIQTAIDEINENMAEARAESKELRKNKIVAKRIMYPETAYQMMSLTLMVREQVPGPVKVVIYEGDIHVKEIRGGRPS